MNYDEALELVTAAVNALPEHHRDVFCETFKAADIVLFAGIEAMEEFVARSAEDYYEQNVADYWRDEASYTRM